MAKMDGRVNLRLDADTLALYTRFADLLTKVGTPMTATQLIRLFVEQQCEQVAYLCSCAERALEGDKGEAHKVFDAILDWNEAQIRVARASLPPVAEPEPKTA
jgi:hypothetical protein